MPGGPQRGSSDGIEITSGVQAVRLTQAAVLEAVDAVDGAAARSPEGGSAVTVSIGATTKLQVICVKEAS